MIADDIVSITLGDLIIPSEWVGFLSMEVIRTLIFEAESKYFATIKERLVQNKPISIVAKSGEATTLTNYEQGWSEYKGHTRFVVREYSNPYDPQT